MKEESTVTKDDVLRLTRGRPSKSRCGSRQIRHRLRLDEREQLTIARMRGYLLLHPSTRTALKNAWYLDCVATSRSCIYAERTPTGYRISGLEGKKPILRLVSRDHFAELFPVKEEGERGSPEISQAPHTDEG